MTLSITSYRNIKMALILPILMQESFWWLQCSDRYIISLFSHLHTPFPLFSPSLINLTVSLIRNGEKGEGEGVIIYLLLHCHH